MTALRTSGGLQVWLMAARPQTLPAGILPVVLATALAHRDGACRLDVALCAALGAMLIQIGTNLFNDWSDYFKGADTQARLGPKRVTQQGLIPPKMVFGAALASFAAAAACGLYLLPIGGWPILLVGVASIASGLLYTGGPFALAYVGLGDLFVFVFFGLVAVCATFFLHTQKVSAVSFVLGAALGLFATAILVVNNLRDRHTDEAARKRTLAVRFGARAARAQYDACMVTPFILCVGLALQSSLRFLAPLVCLPWALSLMGQVRRLDGAALNPLLGRTAKLELVWTGLCSAALMW